MHYMTAPVHLANPLLPAKRREYKKKTFPAIKNDLISRVRLIVVYILGRALLELSASYKLTFFAPKAKKERLETYKKNAHHSPACHSVFISWFLSCWVYLTTLSVMQKEWAVIFFKSFQRFFIQFFFCLTVKSTAILILLFVGVPLLLVNMPYGKYISYLLCS